MKKYPVYALPICQQKTVDEYLFLIVKFISFDLLDFFPYSVNEGGENKWISSTTSQHY